MSDSDDATGAQPENTRPPRYGEPGYVSPYAPPGAGANPYGQPSYGYGQPGIMSSKPDSHMVGAILTTLFCCLPAGIVSIIYAAKVDTLYRAGDYNGALTASSSAKFWMWLSIGLSVVLGLLFVALAVTGTFASTTVTTN